jgi:hypothetical protein
VGLRIDTHTHEEFLARGRVIEMFQNWIAVASAEHVRLGRSQGFIQVSHGKAAGPGSMTSRARAERPRAWCRRASSASRPPRKGSPATAERLAEGLRDSDVWRSGTSVHYLSDIAVDLAHVDHADPGFCR